MQKRAMRRAAPVFVVAAATVFVTPAGGAYPEPGYQPRACGLDMNRNGLPGEPADCRVCDGVTTDPDSDGVAEDLIYVDCTNGADTGACGAPGSPCASVGHAWRQIADGPADGAEDILCLRGVCLGEELVNPGVGGVPGTFAVQAS